MKKIAMLCAFLLLSAFHSVVPGADTNTSTVIFGEGEALFRYGKSHALLIGVSDYNTGWDDLPQVPEELDRVAGMLKKQGFGVIRIQNPNADELSDAFNAFKNKYGRDKENRLLFFFSGHGYTLDDGSQGYLVPRDAPAPGRNEIGFLRKALPVNYLFALARKIEARHALFLFDSCFSHAASDTRVRSLSSTPAHITQRTAQKVRQFITACDAGEKMPDRGVFVPAFVDGISYGKADLNGDGYVTGTELGLYLEREVPKYVSHTPRFHKIRDYDLSQGDFVFVLEKPQAAASKRQPEKAASMDPAIELAFWRSIEQSTDPETYRAYLNQYPNGSFAALARIRIGELKSR